MDSLIGTDLGGMPLVLLSLALAITFGLMTALVARAKKRSFAAWLIYGALAPPIALFHALLLASGNEAVKKNGLSPGALQRCPHCGEAIKRDLDVCPQCWRVLPGDGGAP
jgi:hypothetical protein